MRRLAATLTFLLVGLGSMPRADAGNPWEEIMGRKPKIWTDPEGRFSLDLPVGWVAHTEDKALPRFTRVDADKGVRAEVVVETRTVPAGIKLGHFVHRMEEEVRSVARNFVLIEEDRTEISGTTGARRLFTYQERGHAELTHEVLQVYFVVGERAVTVTLETTPGARGVFWEEFNVMMNGMNATAPGDEIRPARAGEPRKKVRAGEMINPDAAPY